MCVRMWGRIKAARGKKVFPWPVFITHRPSSVDLFLPQTSFPCVFLANSSRWKNEQIFGSRGQCTLQGSGGIKYEREPGGEKRRQKDLVKCKKQIEKKSLLYKSFGFWSRLPFHSPGEDLHLNWNCTRPNFLGGEDEQGRDRRAETGWQREH